VVVFEGLHVNYGDGDAGGPAKSRAIGKSRRRAR
jgi:hypothetical protein